MTTETASQILLDLHKIRFGLAFLALAVCALYGWRRWDSLTRPELRTVQRAGFALSVAAIALFAWLTIGYLTFPGYADHIEPTVAGLAWLRKFGHPLYPAPDYADGVFGTPYGPLLTSLVRLPLEIDTSILGTKLAAVCALWLALAILGIELRRLTRDSLLTTLVMAAVVILLIPFGIRAFWVRAEPFLLLTTALVLVTAIRLPPLAAAATVGVLGGIAAGIRLPGLLSVLPFAAVPLSRTFGFPENRINLHPQIAGTSP